ncbi:MAG: GGDEF domain-containing protein [Gammaproteobacteria bacterium]
MTVPAPVPSLAQDVLEHRLRFLFDQAVLALLTSAVGAATVVLLFRHVTPARIVVPWAIGYAAVVLVRAVLIRRSRSAHGADIRSLTVAFIGITFVAGAFWGTLPVLFPPANQPYYIALAVLWTGGMVAGAIVAYSAMLEVVLAFVIPALLPSVVLIAIRNDSIVGFGIVAGICLYMVFGIAIAARFSNAIARQLLLERENARLLEEVDEDRRQLGELNARLAAELETQRRNAREIRHAWETAERLSTIDPLTGIANRRSFDTAVALEWARAARGGSQLALVMIDIDFFKRFNDRHGHPAGDECLQRVATVIQRGARRPGDMAARYGGEEFALLLQGTGAEDAVVRAETLRAQIEAMGIAHGDSPCGPAVTASFGVAACRPAVDGDAAALVAAADAALYEAKHAGRNRVRSAGAC